MALLRNASTGATLSRCVERAVTPWRRTIGFLFLPLINADRGLWFGRCRAIHTVGMRSPVDLVFLDRDSCVVATLPEVPPNRPFVSAAGARSVLEMGPGFLRRCPITIGERLELQDA